METRRVLGMTVAGFTAVCIAVAILAVFGIGIWRLGWFVANQNLKQQTILEQHKKGLIKAQNQNIQNSMNVQEGYITAIQNYVTAIDTDIVAMSGMPPNYQDLKQQAIQDGRDACHYASLLTGTVPEDPTMLSWIKGNCEIGTLSPRSPIWKGQSN